jgi:hypothetical protein
MTRLFGLVLLACLVVLIGAALVGRAIDVESQERVIFTRAGITFDCGRRAYAKGERIVFEDGSSVVASYDGEVHYTDCHTTP